LSSASRHLEKENIRLLYAIIFHQINEQKIKHEKSN